MGPLFVSSLGGVEIKFSIFFIMFLLIFHVYLCSFMYDEFTFPNADWEALTETWWQTRTWWKVLWFLFWCRRGKIDFLISLNLIWFSYNFVITCLICFLISYMCILSLSLSCSQMTTVVILVKKCVRHIGKRDGRWLIWIWLTRSAWYSFNYLMYTRMLWIQVPPLWGYRHFIYVVAEAYLF